MTEEEAIAADVVKIRARVAEIDTMFETATGWGSWMSDASSERRGLVRQAAIRGVNIPHDRLARLCK